VSKARSKIASEAAAIDIAFAPRRSAIKPHSAPKVIDATPETLSMVGSALKVIFEGVRADLSALAPDEIQIEVGVSIEGKQKFVIVEGSMGGHFKVSAIWRRR
jgi:hypothetical protein